MIESASLTVAILAWLVSGLACVLFMRRTIINVLDPLLLGAVSIPFSAALLAALCETDWIEWEKFQWFSFILLAYLVGATLAGAFFGREAFRRAIVKTLDSLSLREIQAMLLLTVACTLLLAMLGTIEGGGGDARQAFGRAFRPVIVMQSGLFYFALILLLSRRLSNLQVAGWMTTLLLLSIPFSGKSVLAPVLTWFGMKMFIERRTVTFKAAFSLFSLAIVGAGVMGFLAYGVANMIGLFYFMTNRLWMSGDVYIYAYERDALAYIRGSYEVSFLGYTMHPVTSLVGIRAYDKPIGSMLASEVTKKDLLTGPNPHMPIVLDYFFANRILTACAIALLVGFLVVGIRPLSIALAETRSRYVALGGIVAAVFCPAMGFLDTSQVIIALIGILGVTLFGALMEMLRPPSRVAAQPAAGSALTAAH